MVLFLFLNSGEYTCESKSAITLKLNLPCLHLGSLRRKGESRQYLLGNQNLMKQPECFFVWQEGIKKLIAF